MTYRFQPLLFNHYLQTGSTKQTKTILILHSPPRCISDQRFCGPWPLMYLSAGIIFAFGKLHPVVGKLQLSLWGTSTSTMHSCSVQAKGNSSFPAVFEQLWRGEWLRLKSQSLFFFIFCFCLFLPAKATLCAPSSHWPTHPIPQLPPKPSLLLPLSCCWSLLLPKTATVLSIFNYDHTERGFESLSCKAGRFLITKLISK